MNLEIREFENAYSVLNTIIHKESHSYEKMQFNTYFLQK